MTTPYRDDLEATEAEYQRVAHELGQLKANEKRLQTEQLGLEEDLAALRRKLDALRSHQAFPLLENVRVAAPCNVDWDSMSGNETQRFCGQCEKNVYNLSAMNRAEAEAFLAAQTGHPCVRLYRRADDTVITADCPVGVRKRRVRRLVVAGVGGGLVAAGAVLAMRPAQGKATQGEMGEMGEIVALPRAPTAAPSSTAAIPSAKAPPEGRVEFGTTFRPDPPKTRGAR